MSFASQLGYSPSPQTSIGSNRYEGVVKAELALTAWRWGRAYSTPGMIMIAQCIANRHRAGQGTFFQVIERIPKYAATLEEPPRDWPTAWDKEFVRLLPEIDGIVDGTAKDTTNGALYWCDMNDVTNPWFLEQIARSTNHNRVADVAGTLVFFR